MPAKLKCMRENIRSDDYNEFEDYCNDSLYGMYANFNVNVNVYVNLRA